MFFSKSLIIIIFCVCICFFVFHHNVDIDFAFCVLSFSFVRDVIIIGAEICYTFDIALISLLSLTIYVLYLVQFVFLIINYFKNQMISINSTWSLPIAIRTFHQRFKSMCCLNLRDMR